MQSSRVYFCSQFATWTLVSGLCFILGCPGPRQDAPSQREVVTPASPENAAAPQGRATTGRSTAPEHIPAPHARATPDPDEQAQSQLNSKPPRGADQGVQAATGAEVPQPGDGTPSETALQPALPPKYEPLFQDWPQPQLALFITGRQQGYIEPCGCTGLANQKGGLVRRHTLQQQLMENGWPLVALDVGNQVRRFGRQPEIKFQMTIEGLKQIGYQAVAFGPDDLRLSVGELVATTAAADDDAGMFVSANIAVLDPELTPRYKVVTAGGKKIGITAVLGSEQQQKVASDEIILKPASEGLTEVWPNLEQEKCDFYVLLAHASLEQSRQLAQQFPGFDLVVTAGGAGEPTFMPESIPDSKAVMVQVGTKGMYVGVLGLFDDPQQPLRYQRVPLDDRFADSRTMMNLLASYQDQLKALGLDGLGLRPVPHPSGRQFVGSQACGDCHTQAYEKWSSTPHAHATESLVHPNERNEIARHYDPECLSCHVTGWNPQKYYPYSSGYLSLDETPLMLGNGCENCHGPGSVHVAAESGELSLSAVERSQIRQSMRLPLAEAEKRCMECHDLDNSPDFHVPGAFEKYWKEVEHYGRD